MPESQRQIASLSFLVANLWIEIVLFLNEFALNIHNLPNNFRIYQRFAKKTLAFPLIHLV